MSAASPQLPPGAAAPAPPAISLIAHRNRKKLYRVSSTTMDLDERFELNSVVGRGSYGVVCAVTDTVSMKQVAIKKVEHLFSDLIDGRRMYREICVLRLLMAAKARNIVRLITLLQPAEDVSRFQDLYIVTELHQGDLSTLNSAALAAMGGNRVRDARPSRSPSAGSLFDGVRAAATDLLTSIADMHALGIIHRDVKPQNLLVGGPNHAHLYLCDFGLAKGGVEKAQLPTSFTDHVVTRWYRAPELLVMAPYHYSVDVFSAGLVIAELILRKAAFPGRDYLDQVRLVTVGLFLEGNVGRAADWIPQETARTFVQTCGKMRRGGASQPAPPPPLTLEERLAGAGAPRSLIDLVLRLTTFDPSLRPTAAEALLDPTLKDLVVPHPNRDLLAPSPDQDWSVDATVLVSEARLRRLIWNEVGRYATAGVGEGGAVE